MTTIPFNTNYTLIGSAVVCSYGRITAELRLEKDIHPIIKRWANASGWNFYRLETEDQMGFPDIMILRGSEYCHRSRNDKSEPLVCDTKQTYRSGSIPHMSGILHTGIFHSFLGLGKKNRQSLCEFTASVLSDLKTRTASGLVHVPPFSLDQVHFLQSMSLSMTASH